MVTLAIIIGQNAARSAMPPLIMAGMAAAKVNKKKNLVSSYPLSTIKDSAGPKKLLP